jgi:phosphoesterase RecJ-like protein
LVGTKAGISGVEQVVDAFREARRITAICHENPDADTVAGAIAVAIMADRLGKESEIVSVDPLDPAFDFLPRFAEVRTHPALEPDLAVICDAATRDRIGRLTTESADWLSRARLVNVDHHVTNSAFGALNLVDPKASATCEVLAALVEPLGLSLDVELATALLTGIVRDSNGFADPSTSATTLRVTARLVEAGAPLAAVYRRIHHDMPTRTMALWGRMLHAMREHGGGQVVYTILTPAMLAQTGTAQHDADGVAEFMFKGRGVEVAILLRELGPDETRVSLRTAEGVDASAVAAVFGGGGHARRAGCTIHLPAEQAATRVLEALDSISA